MVTGTTVDNVNSLARVNNTIIFKTLIIQVRIKDFVLIASKAYNPRINAHTFGWIWGSHVDDYVCRVLWDMTPCTPKKGKVDPVLN
jgi:hypothetical protein